MTVVSNQSVSQTVNRQPASVETAPGATSRILHRTVCVSDLSTPTMISTTPVITTTPVISTTPVIFTILQPTVDDLIEFVQIQ